MIGCCRPACQVLVVDSDTPAAATSLLRRSDAAAPLQSPATSAADLTVAVAA